LSPSEVERLIRPSSRGSKARNRAIFSFRYVWKKLFAISDEITVMREGRTVAAHADFEPDLDDSVR